MSQFHYGSIEIHSKLLREETKHRSQFHYGSIEIVVKEATSKSWKPVSIPLWFDWNLISHTSLHTTHSSLLTNHQSPITDHQSQFSIMFFSKSHHSPLTPHSTLLTTDSSPLTPHHSLLTNHQSPITNHQSPFSIMVRLKYGIFMINQIQKLVSLNSIMVRLK